MFSSLAIRIKSCVCRACFSKAVGRKMASYYVPSHQDIFNFTFFSLDFFLLLVFRLLLCGFRFPKAGAKCYTTSPGKETVNSNAMPTYLFPYSDTNDSKVNILIWQLVCHTWYHKIDWKCLQVYCRLWEIESVRWMWSILHFPKSTGNNAGCVSENALWCSRFERNWHILVIYSVFLYMCISWCEYEFVQDFLWKADCWDIMHFTLVYTKAL